MQDLKLVCCASTKDLAEDALLALEEKRGQNYCGVIESWQKNWEELSLYFQYTESIRDIIYTTNAVEGVHRQVRTITKTRGMYQ